MEVKQYGETNIEITEEIYLALLQRYKELSRGGGSGVEDLPYDLNPHISKISTGKIDADYMNSRFKKFMRLRHDAAGEQLIEQAKIELFKSFAMLSDEEQEFAQIIIRDIQLGVLMPDENKTFRDIFQNICVNKKMVRYIDLLNVLDLMKLN